MRDKNWNLYAWYVYEGNVEIWIIKVGGMFVRCVEKNLLSANSVNCYKIGTSLPKIQPVNYSSA